jgi:hypothetical protein
VRAVWREVHSPRGVVGGISVAGAGANGVHVEDEVEKRLTLLGKNHLE